MKTMDKAKKDDHWADNRGKPDMRYSYGFLSLNNCWSNDISVWYGSSKKSASASIRGITSSRIATLYWHCQHCDPFPPRKFACLLHPLDRCSPGKVEYYPPSLRVDQFFHNTTKDNHRKCFATDKCYTSVVEIWSLHASFIRWADVKAI